MGTVVPTAPGLEISGVLYNYTTVKDPSDPMLVHVQNEDTEGGYIFRETDDWSGLPGNTIRKYVPTELTNISRWGDGSIEVEGQGEVTNPSVVYTYRIDECFDPQSNPSCPGYEPPVSLIPEVTLPDPYDAMDDGAVRDALAATDPDLYKDDEEEETLDEEEEDKEGDLEKGLAAADNALTLASGVSQTQMLQAMNLATNVTSYYSVTISGGVYKEDTQLIDSKLPENKRGLRNGLAQQILHEKMIEMQYRNFSF